MGTVAGVEDYQVALATYRAAVERWPGTPITLRQGARVIEDSRRLRLASWDTGSRSGRDATTSASHDRPGRLSTLWRDQSGVNFGGEVRTIAVEAQGPSRASARPKPVP